MKNALILTAIIGAVSLYTWVSQGWTPGAGQALVQTEENLGTAKDFTATAIDGRDVSLASFKGKTVVLNFWATWCAPCVIEFPMMLELAQAASKDSVFLFVSVDRDREAINRFVNKYAKALPMDNVHIIWNPDKEIAEKLYGTFQLPETYLIDGGGIIRDKIVGADIDWTSRGMQKKIRNMAPPPP